MDRGFCGSELARDLGSNVPSSTDRAQARSQCARKRTHIARWKSVSGNAKAP